MLAQLNRLDSPFQLQGRRIDKKPVVQPAGDNHGSLIIIKIANAYTMRETIHGAQPYSVRSFEGWESVGGHT